jgi:hypothetical protein
MSTVTETTALATRQEQHGELAITPQQAMAQKEIEGALVFARRFPRSEDDARARLLDSCKRQKFADMVRYSYPRGGAQVEGPSVYLAREAARLWGNLRYGFDIVHDDAEIRTVRAWAWDLETNTRRQIDATFKKLIYRKKGGWQAPDERDIRELTNKQGETAVRNCLLHLLPPDLVDDAIEEALKTLRNDAAKDPAEARKRLVGAFRAIGVTAAELERYLGHGLEVITPDEIADLRGVWKSISDGNSKWAEYLRTEEPVATQTGATMEDLTSGKSQAEAGTPAAAPAAGNGREPTTARSADASPATQQDEQPPQPGAAAAAPEGGTTAPVDSGPEATDRLAGSGAQKDASYFVTVIQEAPAIDDVDAFVADAEKCLDEAGLSNVYTAAQNRRILIRSAARGKRGNK